MAAVFPWARTSRFRIMIVDTTQPPPAHRAPHAPVRLEFPILSLNPRIEATLRGT